MPVTVPVTVPSASFFDVLIARNGAGEAILGHRVGPNGKFILVLERGPWLPDRSCRRNSLKGLHPVSFLKRRAVDR